MTDEKKPPQEVAGPSAQIVLDLDSQGDVIVRATCFGKPDCSLGSMTDHRLMSFALPALLTELREQIKLGRYLTVDESATIAAALFQGGK